MAEARPQTASTAQAPDPAYAWIVAGLLFLFMLINFADRAVLGLAAVPIMQDLGLTHSQFGLIATSFFTLFSVGGVIGGFLVNRVASTWVLAALALIWSLCQLPMMLSVSVAALVVNRVALGFGEGPAYPVALHAAYKWFPNERRAVPTSLIAIGALAGNGIAAPVILAIVTAWSWHAAFGLLGAVGLVWCIAWLAVAREGPLTPEAMSSGEPTARVSYRRLFRCRTVIGVQVVGFCAYWLLTLAVVWLPAFLTQAFGYTLIQAGWIMMLVSLGQIVLLPGLSTLSDGLKQRGVPGRMACGSLACASTLAAGLIIILLARSEGALPIIVCTVIAFSLCNVMFVLGPVLIAEVTPVERRGAVLGVTNAITTLAGPLAPVITGVVVDVGTHPADGARTALLIAGGLTILGALAGFVLIDPEADRARNPPDSRGEIQPA
ncbi:MFS transporter [Microvirga sp. KLBC 81]|uniref:MFS transporter n=1 Tax=Microvirga sp. KLBC 81 TaxID=1862707 RepID=UPI000D50C425|nr:MFS transporter [Microvirga sp. KLBC 81]PVE21067.1 MFS transporter [Microvirga sp. KLBC 81]